MLENIGLAGCGRMGAPMLGALRQAGFKAQGFDIAPSPDPWITTDASDFAKSLRILITVVRDIAQTDDVLFGAQNFVNNAPNLTHIVISSTLSPRYVRDLRDRIPPHIKLVDAPMSGAQIAAQERRLSFMLGGDTDDIAYLQPAFNAMGKHFHPMGPFGTGMSAKVLNNLLAASNTAMTRLVLDWAKQGGIDEEKLLRLINTSSGQNWFASGFDTIEFTRDGYDPENTIGILVKDIDSALDAAPDNSDISLPTEVKKTIRALRPKV